MMTLRPGRERGRGAFDWLDSRHSFSFANYYDPRHMGVSNLRVINDDWIKPGTGFDTHPHQNMEIISYILEGRIEHRDTMGFHTFLEAGDVQVMSAGSGIWHSEFNPSLTDDLNIIQIWIRPNQRGIKPRYAQRNYAEDTGVTLMVSGDGRDGSLHMHQDASLYKVALAQQSVHLDASAGRVYYLHATRGELTVNGQLLVAGDGLTVRQEAALHIEAHTQGEALLFDLAE